MLCLLPWSPLDPWKLSCRPRPTNVLSTRQPSCVEKVQGEEYLAQLQSRRYREMKSKTGGVAASTSTATSTATTRRSTAMTLTKPQEQAKEGWDRILSNVKMNPVSQNPAYLQLLWVVTFIIWVFFPQRDVQMDTTTARKQAICRWVRRSLMLRWVYGTHWHLRIWLLSSSSTFSILWRLPAARAHQRPTWPGVRALMCIGGFWWAQFSTPPDRGVQASQLTPLDVEELTWR